MNQQSSFGGVQSVDGIDPVADLSIVTDLAVETMDGGGHIRWSPYTHPFRQSMLDFDMSTSDLDCDVLYSKLWLLPRPIHKDGTEVGPTDMNHYVQAQNIDGDIYGKQPL